MDRQSLAAPHSGGSGPDVREGVDDIYEPEGVVPAKVRVWVVTAHISGPRRGSSGCWSPLTC